MALRRSSVYLALLSAGLVACATAKDDPSAGPDAAGLPDGSAGDIDAGPSGCDANPCFAGVECTDTPEGFSCGSCPTGTEGDGVDCVDTNACADDPCFEGVSCTDLAAPDTGFECGDCPEGLFGNGIVCTDIDSCAGNPCFPGVTCIDKPAPEVGFDCGTCPTGFEGDGLTCNDIDGCANSPCFDGVDCTDVVAPGTGFECGDCPAAHVGDGQSCDLACDPALSIACGSTISSANDGPGSVDLVDDWACADFSLNGSEIIFQFDAQDAGVATVQMTGLSADLDLLVVKESASIGVCDAADDSTCIPNGYSGNSATNDEEVRWNTVAGESYFIIVDGFNDATSSFNLSLKTADQDIFLNEIGYGTADFVELRNHGACSRDLAGLALLHKASLEDTPHSFTFPANTDVAPGAVLRWVESNSGPYGDNEIDAGVSVLDIPADPGFTALCAGACNTTDCSNMLDYVERDQDSADTNLPGGPACATFSPAPVDANGQSGDASLHRTGFSGTVGNWNAADWGFAPSTRD